MVTLQMGLTAPFWTLLLPMHQGRDPHKPGMAGEGSHPVSQSLCSSAFLPMRYTPVEAWCFACTLQPTSLLFCLCVRRQLQGLCANPELQTHSDCLVSCLYQAGRVHLPRASHSSGSLVFGPNPAGVIHMLKRHAHSDSIAHSSLLSVIVLFCLCVLQGLTHKPRA